MKLFYAVILGVTLFLPQIKAQSPINLTSSNFPSSNDTLRYSSVLPTSPINYTQTGTNFNWDYSALTANGQGLRNYVSSLTTPYALFFFGFTGFAEKTADTIGAGPLTLTNNYNFYKKITTPLNAFIVDGTGMTYSNVPIPSYYSDKDELYVFPLSYPKTDSTTFKFSTLTTSLIPIVYSKTGYRITKVDGWGTITTPYGTEPCLRVITTQYSKDSIKNTIIPFPLGFTNNQRSYQWLTLNSKIPYLEVSGNLVGANFTVSQIRYRDIARPILSVNEQSNNEDILSFYPNPVKNELIIDKSRADVNKVEIIDNTGKLVMVIDKTQLNSLNSCINVESLSPGLYHVILTEPTKQKNFKFIKQ